jgi:hypothetical protein
MKVQVCIIGGGPSGLATAGCLQRRGVAARILERGPDVANSWANYYDRVRLHTGKHLSSLPNAPMGREYPFYVPRDDLVRYLRDYARRLHLEVSTSERVLAVERAAGGGRDEGLRHVRPSMRRRPGPGQGAEPRRIGAAARCGRRTAFPVQGRSFENTTVPEAENMPPTPWQTLSFAPGTCAGAVPRICRTLSCRANIPYMPVWV